MENPFVYGEAVRGEYFADREEEIRELVDDLSRGQNVIVFSITVLTVSVIYDRSGFAMARKLDGRSGEHRVCVFLGEGDRKSA